MHVIMVFRRNRDTQMGRPADGNRLAATSCPRMRASTSLLPLSQHDADDRVMDERSDAVPRMAEPAHGAVVRLHAAVASTPHAPSQRLDRRRRHRIPGAAEPVARRGIRPLRHVVQWIRRRDTQLVYPARRPRDDRRRHGPREPRERLAVDAVSVIGARSIRSATHRSYPCTGTASSAGSET